MPITHQDLVADGILNHRNAMMWLEVNKQRIRIKDITGFTIKYRMNKQSIVRLGDTTARFLPTYATIEGTMTVFPDHGSWIEIVKYHQDKGVFPEVNLKVSLSQEPGVPASSISIVPQEAVRAGSVEITLNDVIFDEISIMTASSENYSETVDIPFSAHKIVPKNRLPGNDLFSVTNIQRNL